MDSDLTLTVLMEPSDKLDEAVLSNVQLLVQGTTTLNLFKHWGFNKFQIDNSDESLVKKTTELTQTLFKLNAHLRNLIKISPSLIDELEKSPTSTETYVPVLYEKTDYLIEFEGFVTKYKTVLDLLAHIINLFYGTKLKTWKRDKIDGIEVIGGKVIVTLENLPMSVRSNASELSEYIKDQTKHLEPIVRIRDYVIHDGRYRNLQGFRYMPTEKKVYPPIIRVGNKNIFLIDFMKSEAESISNFVTNCLVIMLSNLMPDMKITQNENGDWMWIASSLP